ncbi:transcriptional regulator, CarD family [Pelosinus sp. UFO1]|jgi:CarD family transcriptional regulator|nr:transcriptional regulator, CarD family [Pelosinus sp. UFO1]
MFDNNYCAMLKYTILTMCFICVILRSIGVDAMLAIGDKVVYPMHGAGVIEAIEKHEVFGQLQDYYILTMPYGGMRVMIPMKNVENIGLREVIDEVGITKVVDILRATSVQETASWNKRFNLNLTKIKTGSIYEVAEVVRNLMLQDNSKKLSAGERRLLETARKIMVSELVLACGKDLGSIEEWIDELMQENTPGN